MPGLTGSVPSRLGFRGSEDLAFTAAEARHDAGPEGLDEDGHTTSLFPGHFWGEAADAADALPVFNAPKPPPERVSMSAARLSRARRVVFAVTGEGKRMAVNSWRAGNPLPAGAISADNAIEIFCEQGLLAPSH